MSVSPRRDSSRVSSVLATCSALAALASLSACSKEPEVVKPPPTPAGEYAKKFEVDDLTGRTPPKVAFTDATPGSGLEFTHVNGAFGKKYLPETMGAGVALLDYDGDGKLDIFLVQGKEWPGFEKLKAAPTCKLFKNVTATAADGKPTPLKFQDVTKEAGLELSLIGMGATAADYDGDGDPDLFVTALGPCHLLRNDELSDDAGHKSRRFTDVTDAAGLKTTTWTDKKGLEHPSWSTSAAWLDYDADGTLDLFVCQYVHWSVENDVFDTINGKDKAYTIPTKYEADSCRLFRGRSDGTFEDVSKAAGVERHDSKALGIAVDDLNGDGRPDVAVANDTEPNYLFMSQPGGGYLESANDAGMAYDENGRARAGMGIDCADLFNDGRQVVSIGNFSGEPLSMYTRAPDKVFFVDRAAPCRVATPTQVPLKFAVLFCDYDCDGVLDILTANGHIEPDAADVKKDWTYEQPTQLFWNRGDGTFADVSAQCGEVLTRKVVGRGLATGDLDSDGDLDVVLTQNGRPTLLIRNDQSCGNHWLKLRLQGSGRNRDALGAVVTLTPAGSASADKLTQRRVVRTGSSYLSQCDVALSFGLGKSGAEQAVDVRWPSGKKERFDHLKANLAATLVEGAGK